jgi:hypothetical protein
MTTKQFKHFFASNKPMTSYIWDGHDLIEDWERLITILSRRGVDMLKPNYQEHFNDLITFIDRAVEGSRNLANDNGDYLMCIGVYDE